MILIATIGVAYDNLFSPPEIREDLFDSVIDQRGESKLTDKFSFNGGAFGMTSAASKPDRTPGKAIEGMRLNGVALSSEMNESIAFITMPSIGRSKQVKMGDKINVYTCTHIDENSVELTLNEKVIVLNLFEKSGQAQPKKVSSNPIKKPVVNSNSTKETTGTVSMEELRAFRKSLKDLSPEERKKRFEEKSSDPAWQKALSESRRKKKKS